MLVVEVIFPTYDSVLVANHKSSLKHDHIA